MTAADGGEPPEIEWWYMDHRCPVCGAFWEAGPYSHGYYADHMILVHKMHGQRPCDEDCAGCVSQTVERRVKRW